MSIVIESSLLKSIQFTEQELKLEIAIMLYKMNRLSAAKAAKLANMPRLLFQQELGNRKIPVNYDMEELEWDLKTLGIIDDDNN